MRKKIKHQQHNNNKKKLKWFLIILVGIRVRVCVLLTICLLNGLIQIERVIFFLLIFLF
jgi:hypothetical protein